MNRKEYKQYKEDFAYYTYGLEAVSGGPCSGCIDCYYWADDKDNPTDDEHDMASEGHFAWSQCDFCGSNLGGTREPAHADIDGFIHHFDICIDCVYYLEYGRLDDATMVEIERESNDL